MPTTDPRMVGTANPRASSDPLVSVVVPVHRVEPYLHRCVDSILAQTHSNIEVILIDDGSPDRSGAICDSYQETDDRVVAIHQSNLGISEARNAGLAAMHGEYVTFVDSDDWLSPAYVETLIRLLPESGVALSGCHFLPTTGEEEPAAATAGVAIGYSRLAALSEMLGTNRAVMTVSWGKLYPAGLFADIRFPPGRVHEDEFTTYRVFCRTERIVLTTAQLYFYRQRPDSIMGAFNLRNRIDLIDALRERAVELEVLGFGRQWYRPLADECLLVSSLAGEAEEQVLSEVLSETTRMALRKLRGTGQSLLFRVFSEVFLIAPELGGLLYRHYMRRAHRGSR
ncbi:MAG: glycosyltransferase [Propionicimonas sp.]